MRIVIDIIVTATACFAAYLVYVVADQILRQLNWAPPRIIPLVIAMLTLLAVLELGKGIVFFLLIPYAALGIALLVLYLAGLVRTTAYWTVSRRGNRLRQSVQNFSLACARKARRTLDAILRSLPR